VSLPLSLIVKDYSASFNPYYILDTHLGVPDALAAADVLPLRQSYR
jgi:hypothetical protein